ncbi:MAG: copper chaperone PCu(A)C [Tepidiformaceae bacterium]
MRVYLSWRPVLLAALAATLLALAVACGSDSDSDEVPHIELGAVQETDLMGARVSPQIPKADFTLMDTSGEPHAFMPETDGQVTLLFFGYTNCPDICPTHIALLGLAFKQLPEAVTDDITVVFVTTDPERDTPERLRTWLDALGGDSFVGLTGTQDEVDAVQRLYGVQPAEKADLGGGNYAVNHAAYVIAFEKDDIARVVYPGGTTLEMLMNDLPILAGGEPEEAAEGGDSAESLTTIGDIEIVGPSARATTDDKSAVYFVLRNTGSTADRLISAASPSAGDVQIHENVMTGGAMQMQRVEGVDIPAGGEAVLEPGGYHVMLLDLFAPLSEGLSITVELTFEQAGTVTLPVPVISYAAAAGGAHGN